MTFTLTDFTVILQPHPKIFVHCRSRGSVLYDLWLVCLITMDAALQCLLSGGTGVSPGNLAQAIPRNLLLSDSAFYLCLELGLEDS